MTKKAKLFALKEDVPEKTIAKAILVNSILRKIIGSFFLKRNEPKIPVRFFLSERKALNWLNSFKEIK